MRGRTSAIVGALAAILAGGAVARPFILGQPDRTVEDPTLREYTGVYQWAPDAFVYLQLWNELSGTNQLVAFDESGEVRTLYLVARDRFTSGAGMAVPAPVESRIDFQRDDRGTVSALAWQRGGSAPRAAKRADIETREDVQFMNGGVRLTGTLIAPKTAGPHPAVILVHGSGAANREFMVPFAHFLIRHGMAVLTYDKRGVGGSTGDWNTASFDDLAGDVVAAHQYLTTRSGILAAEIGLLGVSQAGWIMPLAAGRAKDIAFVISVSGPALTAAETTLDHAEAEMKAAGMKPDIIADIIGVMKRQYHYAGTGEGWEAYASARQALGARLGAPPKSFPGSPDDPHWDVIRRMYFHDPAPILRELRVPILALFGELDNNILAGKHRSAWESALKAGGHRDYALHVVPKANHLMLEAKTGHNAEMPALQRFAPAYFTIVREWLAARIGAFRK